MYKIGDRNIGKDFPVFIIAELSANHNQNFELALKTIKAAKDAGADAIKIQTYTADTITIDCDNDYFKIKGGTLWDGKNLYQLYKEAYTPWEWQSKLQKYAEELGLIFFSTPFDNSAVDFLEKLNVPCYKIASFEITDIPLIEYVASKGKPMIISTGIASEEDIKDVLNACRKVGNNQISLLKCTSEYPASVEDANLLTIPDMEKRFAVIAGLSDHSMGSDVAIASIVLGAKIIEKHFIISRKTGGPDAAFSMEYEEFKKMVESVRNVEKALGKVTYELTEKIIKSRKYSRSLFVTEDIAKGEQFNEKNVRSIRPGDGLPPKFLKEIIGKKAKIDLKRGTPLNFDSML
ncbi:MAG: pseudaminic acid synthase [Bacteroidetes bacterium GWA2_30_7]|nr:MAG: pseudaminic acid synthase [Bacteroidetes bacterium GWA2_30_7]